MYTSCGWFFDDISGIETVQIMQYAARAIQLAKETDGKDFEPRFKDILEKASTNIKEFANGREVYEDLVDPANIDLNRVGAHIAVSSLFQEYRDEIDIYCYSANIEAYNRVDAGIQALATGRAAVQSDILLEKHRIDFAVLHFGDHNLAAAVNARMSDDAFFDMQQDLRDAFARGDTTELMRIMNISFSGNSYSIWHLFKDQQRHILHELLGTTWQEIEASFRQIYEHSYTIMQLMRGMNIPLPRALSASAEFILNQDLCRLIRQDETDLNRMRGLVDQATRLSLRLDEPILSYETSHKINSLMERFEDAPDDVGLLETIETTLEILSTLSAQLDLQKAQNIFFGINKEKYPGIKKKADSGDLVAKKWIDHFANLAQYMGVKVE
jgi:hypothetical protein